jgi:hypothetical protein
MLSAIRLLYFLLGSFLNVAEMFAFARINPLRLRELASPLAGSVGCQFSAQGSKKKRSDCIQVVHQAASCA